MTAAPSPRSRRERIRQRYRRGEQHVDLDSGGVGKLKIKALKGRPQAEDANSNADPIGSNGQTFDISDIAGYTNFDNGTIHVAQGQTVKGSVVFQVPDGVKVTQVQWTPGYFGSAVQWEVRR